MFDISFGLKNWLKFSQIYVFIQVNARVQATQFRLSYGSPSRFVTIARIKVDISKFSLIEYRGNRKGGERCGA